MSNFITCASLSIAALAGSILPAITADDTSANSSRDTTRNEPAAPRRGNAPGQSASGIRNRVTITTEGDFRVIKSNGWPDHAPGAFPRHGNPNAASEQSHTFRVPLKPAVGEGTEQRGPWWWGVALNGVPFEPGTAEIWNNDRRSGWRYEAATGFLNLGLDEHNAHVQPDGSYHYHALPSGLVESLGGDGKKMLQVGWAADGFPLYTSWAHEDATAATSALRKMKSSYRLKQGARPAQADGPGGNHDGRFTEDFEFVKGSGDLDEFNGRFGVTPEFPEGTYYYCITAEFPFVPRKWRGTPDASFSKGGRGPGGAMRPAPLGGAPRGILDGQPGERNLPPPPIFTALDLNGDGYIDDSEISKAVQSLRKLDANGDGTLTEDELHPSSPAR
jgi:hypothetical protein